MANAKPKKTNLNNKFTMVNVDFSDVQRDEITKWDDDRRISDLDILESIADQGFKVSFSFDAFNDVYVGALTRKRQKDVGAVTPVYLVRHGVFTKLVNATAYFFTVVLASGDSEYDSRGVYEW